MKSFFYFLVTIVALSMPLSGMAQSKPKRDTSKDKVVVRKRTITPSTKNNNKKVVAKNNNKTGGGTVASNSKKQTSTTSRRVFTISSDYAEFGANGGTQTFTVTSTDSWDFSTRTYDWGHLSRQGNIITLRVDPNPKTEPREDYFEISTDHKALHIAIRQARKESEPLRVSTSNLNFGSNYDSKTVTIYTDKQWSISYNTASWIHTTYNGNTLTVRVDNNESSDARNDFFYVNSGTEKVKINVSQQADNFIVGSENVSVGCESGYRSVNVNCTGTWTVYSTSSNWIHASENTSFVGIRVDANYSSADRSGYVILTSGSKFRKITITQDGRKANTVTSYQTPTYHYRENWWKNRVRFGWHLLEIDGEEHALSFRSGLRLRFGKPSDVLNIILGADYAYHTTMNEFSLSDRMKLECLMQQVIATLNIRFNIIPMNSSNRIYIGCEGDYGFRLSEGNNYRHFTNSNTISFAPQLGFNFKHFDFGFEYRMYLKDKGLLPDGILKENRFGGYMTVYF